MDAYCIAHGGPSRRRIAKSTDTADAKQELILAARDHEFRFNLKKGSISGTFPTLKNNWNQFEDAPLVKITNFRTSLGFDACYLFDNRFDPEGTKFMPKLIITPPVPYRFKWVDVKVG